MRRYFPVILALTVLLTACSPALPPVTTVPTTAAPTTEPTTVPPTTVPPTTVPTVPTTAPLHSELYLPEYSVEDVILYFNEVVLAAEFVNGGDPSLLQKWMEPILYTVDGTPTEEDMAVLEAFCQWLNTIEGFPGIRESEGPPFTNLQIHFCGEEQLLHLMGNNFYGVDGAVTFWYMDNAIYDATICYRNDIDQYTRNSVILEEIYNGLGPVQDTALRTDSIIYSGYSVPQALTPMDELILKLLYHPDMRCGMTTEECEAVIRELYY